MPFPELTINNVRPAALTPASRADVAVFVGLVPRRNVPLPAHVRSALVEGGWTGHGPFARSDEAIEALLDVPVAVSSWGEFDALFAWGGRLVSETGTKTLPCALGLAVKSYFAEGGAKAWIVRTGDPLPLLMAGTPVELVEARDAMLSGNDRFKPKNQLTLARLVPGLRPAFGLAVPGDPATWTGCAHIWGIDDAAMLLLPDLPELFSGPPTSVEIPSAPSPISEHFKPCDISSSGAKAEPEFAPFASITAPRLSRAGYDYWAKTVRHVLDMLAVPRGAAHRRDVILLASLPLPATQAGEFSAGIDRWPFGILDALIVPPKPAKGEVPPPYRLTDRDRLGSARLQLAYPWIATEASQAMPEAIEGAEGVLAGLVARSALSIGGFRSVAGQQLASVRRIMPELGGAALRQAALDGRADWLGDRISLIGRKPSGLVLLSDSTMAANRAWRAGGVSRLIGIILRAARWVGQDRLFEPSGPALWASIKADFDGFMEELRRLGALTGATPQEAYDVRCDASTMSRSDIDSGRVIVTIAFTAAQPIERISVTLSLNDEGSLPMQVAA